MPAIPPGQPVAPGVVTATSGYPQYGVGGGVPGKPGGWKIVTATNSKQKLSYAQQGYLIWFTSQSAAQSYVTSESSPYTSGNPPIPPNPLFALFGIAGSLEAFFGALTDGKMWRSLAWIILGILLMVLGVVLWIGPSAARRSPIGLAASVAKQAGSLWPAGKHNGRDTPRSSWITGYAADCARCGGGRPAANGCRC